MTDQPLSPTPRRPFLIPFLVGGLPVGLFIMGVLSFVLYFRQKSHHESHPSQLSSMMRQDLNQEEYQRYVKTLRETTDPDSVASYIQSTLGLDNMGYDVVHHDFGPHDKTNAHFEAEIRGQQQPRHLVLVASPYGSPASALPLSALLSLAHSFTGEKHANTIRFAALFDGDNGGHFTDYQTWMAKTDWDQIDLIVLGSDSNMPSLKSSLEPRATHTLPFTLPPDAPLTEVKKVETAVRQLADKK